MVVEKTIPPFFDWLFPGGETHHLGALLFFLIFLFGLFVVSFLFAYVISLWRHGPVEAFYVAAKGVRAAVVEDFPNTSTRRVLAMARLAAQESLRRRVLVVFAIFALVLLFAGWFLDTNSEHPARLYISFVLTSTERLVLLMAILLSTFSLPNDIKNRTIYTIATKPVRASEMVLGRITGFVGVNTVLLLLMGVTSYVFVVRGIAHTHQSQSLELLDNGRLEGETTLHAGHRHTIVVDQEGRATTLRKMDHYHEADFRGEGEEAEVTLGSARGALMARSPIYGELRFLDRQGNPGPGISVGKEWTYRKYIEGDSLAAGVWTFQDLNASQYPESLPLEMTLSVFRTYKADIVSGVGGALQLRNPETLVTSQELTFTAREFTLGESSNFSFNVPRRLEAIDPESLENPELAGDADQDGKRDIFEAFVSSEGKMEILIRCTDSSQYFGMARADLYVRGPDGLFAWNFTKSYISIWLQMVMLTCFGVTFSTLVSGAVAMLATLSMYTIGFFSGFITKVFTGKQVGGGPLESLLRIVTQKNISIELDMGTPVDTTVPIFDSIYLFVMWGVARAMPKYQDYNTSSYVAYGFNISNGLLMQQTVTALAYAFTLTVLGYFFLKTRELAA